MERERLTDQVRQSTPLSLSSVRIILRPLTHIVTHTVTHIRTHTHTQSHTSGAAEVDDVELTSPSFSVSPFHSIGSHCVLQYATVSPSLSSTTSAYPSSTNTHTHTRTHTHTYTHTKTRVQERPLSFSASFSHTQTHVLSRCAYYIRYGTVRISVCDCCTVLCSLSCL